MLYVLTNGGTATHLLGGRPAARTKRKDERKPCRVMSCHAIGMRIGHVALVLSHVLDIDTKSTNVWSVHHAQKWHGASL